MLDWALSEQRLRFLAPVTRLYRSEFGDGLVIKILRSASNTV